MEDRVNAAISLLVKAFCEDQNIDLNKVMVRELTPMSVQIKFPKRFLFLFNRQCHLEIGYGHIEFYEDKDGNEKVTVWGTIDGSSAVATFGIAE